MVKCKGCGVELLEGTVFCPYCGAQVQTNEEQKVDNVSEPKVESYSADSGVSIVPKEKGAFKVFALLGMIFGIVNMSLTLLSIISDITGLSYLIALLGIELAVPGFVFSIIGKKSITNHGKAVFGFIANLVCMILLFILAIVFMISMAEADGGSYGGGYYY